MKQLAPFLLLSTLSLYALLTWAHDGATDVNGCHEDSTTGGYHCHTGPLAGREFVSANEAADALQALQTQDTRDASDEQLAPFTPSQTESTQPALPASLQPLRALSWNFSTIGKERKEYDRLVSVLADYDIAALQEVEFTQQGETPLMVIANLLQKRLGERICKGWFKSSTGDRGRHAFLWRDQVVAYVEKNGEFHEHCPDAPQVIRIDSKKLNPMEPYYATFFLKPKKQMFVMASVFWDKKPKKADREIASAFRKLSGLAWPIVVAGNFKISPKDKAFKETTNMKFKPVLEVKGKTENLWTRNVSVVRQEAVSLRDRFPELSSKEIDSIAKNGPIAADLSFSEKEADALKTELVKRTAKEKAAAAKKTKAAAASKPKPPPQPMDVHDNLEEEADAP